MFEQIANRIELVFDTPQRADVLLHLAVEVFVFSASNISRITRQTTVEEASTFRQPALLAHPPIRLSKSRASVRL